MALVHDYRIKAKLSKNQLCKLANVDYQTLTRAEKGESIYEHSAQKIADALGKALGQEITVKELEIRLYQAPGQIQHEDTKQQFKKPGLLQRDRHS